MADVTSPVNDNARDLDPLVTAAGYVGIKRGRRRVAATSITPDTLAETFIQDASSTGTLANVSGSASSVTLLAANLDRLGAIIVNDSTAILYVKFGSSASATSYTYLLQPFDTVDIHPTYTGIITGIWASATGAARVTEVA